MTTFNEVFDEIKGNVSVSKSGKVKKTFSKSDFDKLLQAFLNDSEYEMSVAKTKGGEMVVDKSQPVKAFRGMIKRILVDFGVDAQDAAKIESEYQIRNVDGLYEVICEIIYTYCKADKKFVIPAKEDFGGMSVTLKSVEKTIKEYSKIRGKDDKGPAEKFTVESGKHSLLVSKSKCPTWLKKKKKSK